MSGTDIYILGFDSDEDWVSQMVASVLDGSVKILSQIHFIRQ